MAEGVGFEPTEAQKTSTVFETVPFVRSGSLPPGRLSLATRTRTGLLPKRRLPRTVTAVIDTANRSATDLASGPASAMQLLGLDTRSPLPTWMLLNAVRHQRFSGEVTLHTMPAVRVWAVDGTVYWAERAGALAVADRLVELGVLDQQQAANGTTQLGDAGFVGQLFTRVPNLNRDEVMNALGYVRDTIIAEVAELIASRVDVAAGRHHPSGIVFWFEGHDAPPACATPAPVAHTDHTDHTDDVLMPEDVAAAVRQALAGIRASLTERSTGTSTASGSFTFTYLDDAPVPAATEAPLATRTEATRTPLAAMFAAAEAGSNTTGADPIATMSLAITPATAPAAGSDDSGSGKRRRLFGRRG